jgi:hypothetical protein
MKHLSEARYYLIARMHENRNPARVKRRNIDGFIPCSNEFCDFHYARPIESALSDLQVYYCNICDLNLCEQCAPKGICRYCGTQLLSENKAI